jgi:hypothetical protein
MKKLRIIVAAALTLMLGYALAFGSGDYGPGVALAAKTTSVFTTTSFAGNSDNVKGVTSTTTTKAGQGGGGGSFKGTSTTTAACKPTGNPAQSCP